MTNQLDKYLKIKKELSENRQRLGVIGLLTEAEVTTEVRAEQLTLRQRQPVAEGELQVAYDEQRAAQEQGVTLDTADTELRALTKKANVGDVLSSVMERRVTTGATAELQQHFGIGSHQVPLEMLRIDRGVEERAAATVPGSIGDASQAEVISPVFASGDGAFLGIERPTVAVGDSSFPLLSTRPTVAGPFSDSSDAAQTDATFVANSLSPERLQASYSYRRSDAARFAGLDSSLRLALNSGLTEKLDQQVINGSSGLLNGTNLSNNTVSALTSWLQYLDRMLYGRVDGRFARSPADVRILLGTAVYSHLSSLYRANETDETASERLAARSGGLMVSPHVPGLASKRQNVLMRLGMERGAGTQPLWQGVSLVVDEVTRATQGEIVVHAILLANFAITDSSRFFKQQAQTSA